MGGKHTRELHEELLLKRLEVLKATAFVLWSKENLIDYLECVNVQKNLMDLLRPIVEAYEIDGDGFWVLVSEGFFDEKLPSEIGGVDTKGLLEGLIEYFVLFRDEEKGRVMRTEEFNEHVFEAYDIPEDLFESVLFYHRATWNTKTGGSRALNRNWSNQPSVQRRWYGANLIRLHKFDHETTPLYNEILVQENGISEMSAKSISSLLFYSFSCTAHKDATSTGMYPNSSWSKRVNASSGGLHPVEIQLIFPKNISNELNYENGSETHIYHYSVKEHGIENIGSSDVTLEIPDGCFLLAVSSINWREIWKYGERGYRYNQLDIGHSYGSLLFSCLMLGWQVVPVNFGESNITDTVLSNIFNYDLSEDNDTRMNREDAGILFLVVPNRDTFNHEILIDCIDSVIQLSKGDIIREGYPNDVSYIYYPWDVVHCVTNATYMSEPLKNPPAPKYLEFESLGEDYYADSSDSISGSVFRLRRSALDYWNFERNVSKHPSKLNSTSFFGILSRLLPQYSQGLWENFITIWGINVHMLFYVIEVENLVPGIYILFRDNDVVSDFREILSEQEFSWDQPNNNFNFFLLREYSVEEIKQVSYEASCSQRIAENAAFTCGMFVNLKDSIGNGNLPMYRMLHWECGLIGSILYREAQARKLGATGMGCYLDDMAFEIITGEIDDVPDQFVSLYHFSVGIYSHDDRYPPYQYETSMGSYLMDEIRKYQK